MAESEDERKIIQFENLNVLGKVVYVGGFVTRMATSLVDTAVHAATEIVTEAEKAFKQGLDPNVEDAKIIEESDERE